MKIKYEFVTGETVEVEVSVEMAAIHSELDREEYNNEHTETRRHLSLDIALEHSDWLASNELNPINITEAEFEAERIQAALAALTNEQQDLVYNIFICGMSVNDYAAKCGVDHSAISHRIKTIRKKLKKIL